ncbi:MAG: DNA polymerase IV [Candidatus Portnoybacteria bacterium]|nr:DNA polymerase IV [Candidatus Portnoybacteria bacterium]
MQKKISERIILHVDMDAFFAAIEERDDPRLQGLPIVVGADPKNGFGRGVVSTANYKARAYGIHSAMPISKAWRLSEEAFRKGLGVRTVFLPVNINEYQEVSKRISVLLQQYTPLIEQASIDEFYLDISQCSSMAASQPILFRMSDVAHIDSANYRHPMSGNLVIAKSIAIKIKEGVWQKEKLACSIGIGPNKLIAKIASGFQKPNGLTTVPPEKVEEFLAPLSTRVVPGVGPKTEVFLNQKGIKTIKELREISKHILREWLGKWGEDLYFKARGIDESQIETERQRKSLGHQETLPFDTLKTSLLIKTLRQLTHETVNELREEHLQCRTVEVKVRFADFETKTRSRTLPSATDNYETIWEHTLSLFLPFLDTRENPKRKLMRLIGVSVSNLV